MFFAPIDIPNELLEAQEQGKLVIAGLLACVVVGVGLMVSQAVDQIMPLVSSILF